MKFKVIFEGQPLSKDNIRMRNKKGQYYLPKKYKKWEKEKQLQFCLQKEYWGFPLKKPLEVFFDFYYKDRRYGDLGNAEKSICDAMNKVFWMDDKQIEIIHKRRFLDKDNPRIVLTVIERGRE